MSLLSKIRHLPDWIRRPLRVFVFGFVGVFAVTLTGWLQEVAKWANSEGDPFPSLGVLGKAAVAAAASAAVTTVALIVNLLEDKTKMPALLKAPPSSGENPVPDPKGDGGLSTIELCCLLIAASLVVLALVALLGRPT